MSEKNWNLLSNNQLEEERDNLEKEYEKKQVQMLQLHEEMVQISTDYKNLSEILNKRQGKK